MNQTKQPEISAVVCTYNRADALERCLRGFAKQSLSPERFEVLVVDNNSTDKTRDLVSGMMTDHAWLHYEVETKQGLSHARNAGIMCSRADLIAFTDDDAIPDTDFLTQLLEAFARFPEALSVGGRIDLDPEVPLPSWVSNHFDCFYGKLDLGDEPLDLQGLPGPIGVNMAFRRHAFAVAGLFNPKLGRTKNDLISNEEHALFLALKQRPGACMYWPAARVRHWVPAERLTREWIFRRVFYQGISDAYLGDAPAGLTRESVLDWARRTRRFLGLLRRGRMEEALEVAIQALGEGYGQAKRRLEER